MNLDYGTFLSNSSTTITHDANLVRNVYEENKKYTQSLHYLEIAIKVKVIATLIVLGIGLVGHFLTIFVFSQKRFRINSSNVFLLCLAINDGLYLIIHFFEETIIATKDVFITDSLDEKTPLAVLIKHLNIIDKNESACRIINYLRYVLRFTSAYIIVLFTVQRVFIVYFPLQNRYKSKKSAWKTVTIIACVSIVLNVWAAFIFEIRQGEIYNYCAVKKIWVDIYFNMNAVYIMIIMLIPIVVIVVLNFLIIMKTTRDDFQREQLKTSPASALKGSDEKQIITTVMYKPSTKQTSLMLGSDLVTRASYRKPHIISLDHGMIKNTPAQANTKSKLTRMLILISFSYAFLNLPHLITWSLYFGEIDAIKRNHLFTVLQITEIFYMTNYGIHFYLYCLSGTKFRTQLKYSHKNYKNIFLYD